MIEKYKTVSIIYGGIGRKYAELLRDKIEELANNERYPINAKIILESLLTRELLTDVMNLFKESEFCVAFLTADNLELVDGVKYRLRQNVVFELGMALVCLGRERCILLSDFDCSAEDVQLPSDMNSLEIREFKAEDIDSIIDKAIYKILKDSKVSLASGVENDQIPQYKNLLNCSEYYIDYENLFCEKVVGRSLYNNDYYKIVLDSWYEECSSLLHYDEQCIYLLERLCFIPIFGKSDDVNNFMGKVYELVSNYKKWDISYYRNTDLLNFVCNLVHNVIEYTTIKLGKDMQKELFYEKLLEKYLSEDIPEDNSCNPLILLVYFDYLGLIYLKLSVDDCGETNRKKAIECFEKAAEYLGLVDMSLQIWGGFIYYNMARTYVLLEEYDKAEKMFKKAVNIRRRWLDIASIGIKIKNALSSEYFMARVSYLELYEQIDKLTKIEMQREYEMLEIEINAYSNLGNDIDPLVEIRKKIAMRRHA